MDDTNTFGEYRQITLPYQRSGNDLVRTTQARSQQSSVQRQVPPTRAQQRPAPTKMPKAKALALLRKLKRGIVVASFLSFGTFSTLVMSHTVGTTTATSTQKTTSAATATPTTTTQKATPTATQQATPTTTTTQPTTTQQGGGYGFGSSNSASNPVSGTHTS